MSKYSRVVLILILVFIFAGCLLPWGCRGDLVTICDKGIVISFQSGFRIENNGGYLAIFLTFIIAALIFYRPRFLRNSILWASIVAVILLIYSIANIGIWLIKGDQQIGIIGAPMPAIGLWLVLVGSIAMLFLALLQLRSKYS